LSTAARSWLTEASDDDSTGERSAVTRIQLPLGSTRLNPVRLSLFCRRRGAGNPREAAHRKLSVRGSQPGGEGVEQCLDVVGDHHAAASPPPGLAFAREGADVIINYLEGEQWAPTRPYG
jgi:hypothetical protein